jgi:DnaB-like helicase N terminal domain/Protein of unknown function (DUF3987)
MNNGRNGDRNGNGYSNGYSHEYVARPGGIELERMPPHNIEAEESVLGSILLDNDVLLEIVDILRVDDFYRDDHQVVYQAILDLYERGQMIDAVTLCEELERDGRFERVGGNDLLEQFLRVPHSLNAGTYAKIVKEKASTRRMIERAQQIVRDGYSNQYTVDELLDRAEKSVLDVRHLDSIEPPDEDLSLNPLPEKMSEAAFTGLAGEIANIVGPETEACREAILVQFLVAFGNNMGARPFFLVGGTAHRCNLYTCLVGATGAGRKGTSFDAVNWLMRQCDERWNEKPPVRGLQSGEGLIAAVDDRRRPVLCVETEFGGTLGVMGRQNNTLCSVFKQAWEGPYLSITTKNHSVTCDEAYVSLIAHITAAELKLKLCHNDIENGLVNRILWVHSYRSKSLPEGGNFKLVRQALAPLLSPLTYALDFAQRDSGLEGIPYLRTPEARERWRPLYEELTSTRAGDYGSATQRRAAFVMRLAVIYAVLDREFAVSTHHLESALAVWEYCDRTAAHLWGSPKLEGNLGKLLAFMELAKTGVSRTEINRKAFHGRLTSAEIDRLLSQAQSGGQIVYRKVKTGGRDRHEWVHRKNLNVAEKAEKAR